MNNQTEPEVHVADYHLLAVLIAQLPKDRKWTKERKDKWLQALASNIEFLTVTVIDE